jgi:hypothetical protein
VKVRRLAGLQLWAATGRQQHGKGILSEPAAVLKKKKKKEKKAHRRAEARFGGVFIIAVHRAFVLGLGARHRGIVELSEGVIRCVTVFASAILLLLLLLAVSHKAFISSRTKRT